MRYFGHLSPAGTTERIEAVLLVGEPDQAHGTLFLALQGRQNVQQVTIAKATAPIGNSAWRLILSTGDIVHLTAEAVDDKLMAFMPANTVHKARLGRLENVRWRGILIMALLFLGVVYGFRQSIVPLGDLASKAVSIKLADRISELTLSQLDQVFFDQSQLSKAERDIVTADFERLLAVAPPDFQNTRLHFRTAPLMGPNAFALAGNDIVILDEMITFADDREIVSAVLAHELGHVINRHALRQIMRSVVFTIGVSVAIGADESIIEEMAALGGSFILSKYAREFELEADQVSVDMLRRVDIAPDTLAVFFKKLQATCGDKCDGGNFLASHPSFDSRIDAISGGHSH